MTQNCVSQLQLRNNTFSRLDHLLHQLGAGNIVYRRNGREYYSDIFNKRVDYTI